MLIPPTLLGRLRALAPSDRDHILAAFRILDAMPDVRFVSESPDGWRVDDLARLFAGESGVRIWREKRGMNEAELCRLALVPLDRLKEIEAGAKPNGTEAWTLPGSLQIPEEQLFA
jgi:hypothetical protein